MSKKLLSPGQKRRRWITLWTVLLTAAAIALIGVLPRAGQKEAKAFEANHQSAMATVTSAEEEIEQYRNWKGKERERSNYYISYNFDADGQTIEVENAEVSFSVYADATDEQIEVWYPAGQPDAHQFAIKVKATAHSNPLTRILSSLLYVIPIAFFLRMLLITFFGNEPKGYLPEGFYTDNSWLDIEDNRLVMMVDGQIRSLEIDKKKIDAVRKLYQNGGSYEEMLAAANGKLTTVDIASIYEVTSRHYKDTIDIGYKVNDKEESLSLEFLNDSVKLHALGVLEPLLPEALQKAIAHKTRLQSIRGGLFVVAAMAAASYFFPNKWVIAAAILLIFLAVKAILPRLWDPTIETSWSLPEPKPAVS